jgi:hypothetical protein
MTDNQTKLTALAAENIDELVSLLHRNIDLLLELKRALLIADLLGMKPKEMTGKIGIRVQTTGYRPRLSDEMIVTLDGAEMLRKPLRDVPREFWPPEHLRVAK